MTDFRISIHTYLASVSTETGGEANTCSILLDVMEDDDWRTMDLEGAVEPEIVDVVPALLPRLVAAAQSGGSRPFVQVGPGSGTPMEVASDSRLLVSLLHVPCAERGGKLYPIRLWFVPEREEMGGCGRPLPAPSEGYEDFLASGGIVVNVVRSALSLYAGCGHLSLARTWVQEAVAGLDVPIAWHDAS